MHLVHIENNRAKAIDCGANLMHYAQKRTFVSGIEHLASAYLEFHVDMSQIAGIPFSLLVMRVGAKSPSHSWTARISHGRLVDFSDKWFP
jgi:hypothetical protein